MTLIYVILLDLVINKHKKKLNEKLIHTNLNINYLASIDEPRHIGGRKRFANRTRCSHMIGATNQFLIDAYGRILLGQLDHLHVRQTDGRVKKRCILGHLTVKLAG